MKAVILAAGEGSRMRPLTCTRPKGMLPVAGKPILEHLLVEAARAGIREFVFVVGYQDDKVRDYFGDGGRWGVGIEYRFQGKPMGTAQAVLMAKDAVSGPFLVINGDSIVYFKDVSAIITRSGTILAIKEVENTGGLGVVEIKSGLIVRLHEKSASPPTRLANAGLYRFTPAIFEAIAKTPLSPRGEYELTHSIQLLIDGGEPVACHGLDSWSDVSYPWDLLGLNESLLEGLVAENSGFIEEGATIKGACRIGKGSRIRSGSYIVGPVVIGESCDIGPSCYIRPATTIGDGCRIGAAVEVKNSIIMRGTKVPHFSYVGDSVIGESCNLGAGTKIANLRLDGASVEVAGADTRRRKLGAILGDGVETGINASINVGTLIGNGARIGPGALVSGIITPGARLY